jgi:hypothetical protein
MHSPTPNNARLLVAVIGASGVVAIGALSVAIGQQQAEPAVMVSSANSTAAGPTSATTTPMMAVPLIKGPAPLPTEEQGPAAP